MKQTNLNVEDVWARLEPHLSRETLKRINRRKIVQTEGEGFRVHYLAVMGGKYLTRLQLKKLAANIEEHSKGIVGHYGTKASCLKLVDGRKVVMSYLAFTKAQSRIIQKEIAAGHRKYL